MSKAHAPELKRFLDKRMMMNLNGRRKVCGVLRGFDPFMNVVLDEAIDESNQQARKPIGMVVIRGNSIISVEALEKIY